MISVNRVLTLKGPYERLLTVSATACRFRLAAVAFLVPVLISYFICGGDLMVSCFTVCPNECIYTNKNRTVGSCPRAFSPTYHNAALSPFQEMMDDYTESNHDIMLGGHQGLTLDRWA